MFFSDLFLGVGSLAVAFAVADSIRHYFPNSIRLITAGLIVFTVDALVPQFSRTFRLYGSPEPGP